MAYAAGAFLISQQSVELQNQVTDEVFRVMSAFMEANNEVAPVPWDQMQRYLAEVEMQFVTRFELV